MDTIKKKAGFFARIGKGLRYRKATKSVERAERDYMSALEPYSQLKREWRIRRFVAYNFEGFHVSKNPHFDRRGVERATYPSGED